MKSIEGKVYLLQQENKLNKDEISRKHIKKRIDDLMVYLDLKQEDINNYVTKYELGEK